ncbi:Fur family transcriptional regulator [Patescibacteria group bacterium]
MITNKDRVTNQQVAILDYLQSTKSHPTADDVFQAVQKKLPRISLGTVYRNLKKLHSHNLLNEIEYDGIMRYDACTDAHHHLFCNDCKKIIDYNESFSELDTFIKNKKIGKLQRYSISFYGVCTDCERSLI